MQLLGLLLEISTLIFLILSCAVAPVPMLLTPAME
jgi:hypothetical protein